MMLLLALLLCAMASKAILDVWFLGSIFSWGRAWGELFRDEGKWWITRKFGELVSCRICLSYHTAMWVSLLCIPILSWWLLPVWWLAVRTLTRFLDLFEERLDDRGEVTDPPDDGAHGAGGTPSLFD